MSIHVTQLATDKGSTQSFKSICTLLFGDYATSNHDYSIDVSEAIKRLRFVHVQENNVCYERGFTNSFIYLFYIIVFICAF